MKKVKSMGMLVKKRDVKLFITFFFVYAFFTQWYGWNEQSHFSLTRAIVEEKRFEIDSFANQTGDRSFFNNHYYTDKTPGLSLLSTSIYYVWHSVYHNLFPKEFIEKNSGDDSFVSESIGDVYLITYVNPGFFIFTSMILLTIFTSSLFASLTALLIYKISKYLVSNERYSILITIAYAFGTITFVSSLHFMSHATGTFFAFLSFFLLFKSKMEKLKTRKFFFLAGIFIGLAVVLEYSIVLISVILLAYAFTIDKNKSLLFFLALLIGIAPLFLYNFLIFGNPLDFAVSHIDRQIYRTAYPETRIFFSSEDYQEKIMKSSFFPAEDLLKHFHLGSNPNFYIILRLLFYPYRGLFFYSPVLFLSLFGMMLMWKEYKKEVILILSVLILFLWFLSMRDNWWGGYFFGNRYLIPTIPFLTLPLIHALKRLGLKLFLPVVLLSIFFNSLGLQPAEDMMYDWNNMRPKHQEEINSLKILYNPLLTHYLPSFLTKGPRSWVFENLVNGQVSIDIRVNPISKGTNFPFSGFYVPFLCLIPVFLILILIWKKEIIRFFKLC
jgi:hypothetical protein